MMRLANSARAIRQAPRCVRVRGFTLVELLVVIAIIAILVLLLLPAINAARESARRLGCANNLAQIGIALASYQASHEAYPPGVVDATGPVPNQRGGFRHSWIVQLLPYIDEVAVYRHVDKTQSATHANNLRVAQSVRLQAFTCPSHHGDPQNALGEYLSNYAACHHDVESPIDADNHGVMSLNSAVRPRDVTDGLAKTIFAGEKVGDEPTDQSWLSGTRGALRNTGTPINQTGTNASGKWLPAALRPSVNGEFDPVTGERIDDEMPSAEPPAAESPDSPPAGDDPAEPVQQDPASSPTYVGGFGSEHVGGAQFLFGDGRVDFLSDNVDMKIYQQLGHRADGQLLGAIDDL